MDTISDRLRIPWLRGAKKVNISIVPPLILLPVFLRVASWHFLLGGLVLSSLPGLLLWYYYLTHRRKGHTLFFLSLGLFSLGYMPEQRRAGEDQRAPRRGIVGQSQQPHAEGRS